MTTFGQTLCLALVVGAACGWSQPEQRAPRIGYLYPAGGQQGAVFQITVGGQYLNNVTNVYLSGAGVHATVVKYYRPLRNLDPAQRQALQERIAHAWHTRLAALPDGGADRGRYQRWFANHTLGNNRPVVQAVTNIVAPGKKSADRVPGSAAMPAPEHPLFENLESKTLRELQHVIYELAARRNMKQPNVQLAEMVVLEIRIASNAAVGARDMRLGLPWGLTNPMRFEVGNLPETCELEPNQPEARMTVPAAPPLPLPLLVNGQISPGDVDRFSFQARAGQQIVLVAHARRLIPYLADAVPGWFQPTLALYDETGREIAFADDYRFDPDPVLCHTLPRTGVYTFEIRDALYRGREDFVYRVAVGELPFITAMYPLGGAQGAFAAASIDGWNLPHTTVRLDTRVSPTNAHAAAVCRKTVLSNPMHYAVDLLPEYHAGEPNNALTNARAIRLPRTINGIIAMPGDVDVFRIAGQAGRELVADVAARTLNSPLDSLLKLMDERGQVIAWNDDFDDQESGLATHAADAYLRVCLPHTGAYFLSITDAQNHGGKAYGYRLRVGPPQPDFALRVTPATLNLRAGRAAVVTVHIVRKDGFAGAVDLALADAPAGFTIQGGRIPPGRDRLRMTVQAPAAVASNCCPLVLVGAATIHGKTIRHRAVPCEDMMQAFAYRHLVPSQELLAFVSGGWGGGWGRPAPPAVQTAVAAPVLIPTGGSARVEIVTPRLPNFDNISFELDDPPQGLTLGAITATRTGLTLELNAGCDPAQLGRADNLIVYVFMARPNPSPRPAGGPAAKQQRMPLGVLPAIPFQIVKQ